MLHLLLCPAVDPHLAFVHYTPWTLVLPKLTHQLHKTVTPQAQAGFTTSKCQGVTFLKYRFMNLTSTHSDSISLEKDTRNQHFKVAPQVHMLSEYAQQSSDRVCEQVQALTQRELLPRRESSTYIFIIVLYLINLFQFGIVSVSSQVPRMASEILVFLV